MRSHTLSAFGKHTYHPGMTGLQHAGGRQKVVTSADFKLDAGVADNPRVYNGVIVADLNAAFTGSQGTDHTPCDKAVEEIGLLHDLADMGNRAGHRRRPADQDITLFDAEALRIGGIEWQNHLTRSGILRELLQEEVVFPPEHILPGDIGFLEHRDWRRVVLAHWRGGQMHATLYLLWM